jgi:hypothetical protein
MSKFLNMTWGLKGIEAFKLRVFWIVVQAEIHKISSETLPFKFC